MISRAAKASATKRNNQARNALPLFGDQVLEQMGLLTTPEQQEARLAIEHEKARVYLERIERKYQQRLYTLPIVEAWAQRLLPVEVVEEKRHTLKYCPVGYGWDVWPNALADWLKVSRLEMWMAMARFCGLKTFLNEEGTNGKEAMRDDGDVPVHVAGDG